MTRYNYRVPGPLAFWLADNLRKCFAQNVLCQRSGDESLGLYKLWALDCERTHRIRQNHLETHQPILWSLLGFDGFCHLNEQPSLSTIQVNRCPHDLHRSLSTGRKRWSRPCNGKGWMGAIPICGTITVHNIGGC